MLLRKTLPIALVLLIVIATCRPRDVSTPVDVSSIEDAAPSSDAGSSVEDATSPDVEPPPASDAAPQSTPPVVPPGGAVLLIGDSQAAGMSHHFTTIASACGYRPIVHFRGSTTTFQWINWISGDVAAHSPDLVVVVLGTNDAFQLSRARAEDSYRRFVSHLGGKPYLWVLPPNVDPRRVPDMDSTRAFMVASLRSTFDSATAGVPLSQDGVHSTLEGYAYWASEVWSHMASVGIVYCDHSE